MSGRTFAVFMAVLAVIGLLAFGVVTKGERTLEVGNEVPVAELPMLAADESTSGPKPVDATGYAPIGARLGSLADYRSQWVLLNVWASWCIPCEDEAPELVEFQRRHAGPDFTILGLNTQDGTQDAQDFIREYDLNYPSLRDGSGDYADELGTTGVPETILIDPEGKVAYYRPGQVDTEILDANVLPLIEGAEARVAAEPSEAGNE